MPDRILQVAWTFFGRFMATAGSLIFLVLIARQIGQEQMGIVATPLVLYMLIDVCLLNPVRKAVVRTTDLAADDLPFFAFVGLAGAGLAALGVCAVGAFAIGAAGGEVLGLPMTLLAAFMAIACLRAMRTVHHGLLLRGLRHRTIASAMGVGTLIGGMIGYVASLAEAGPWSIVLFHAFNAAIQGWMLRRATAKAVMPRWSAPAWSRHKGFLREFVASEGMLGLGRQLDILVLPIFVGPATMGLYFMARRGFDLFAQLIEAAIADPAFVSYARAAGDRAKIVEARAYFLALLAAIALPAYAGVAMVAPDVFALALGQDWREAGTFMQILAVVGVFRAGRRFMNTFFTATGRTRIVLAGSAATLAVSVVAMPVAAAFGPYATLAVYGAIMAATMAAQCRAAHRDDPFRRRDMVALLQVAAAVAVMAGAVFAVRAAALAQGLPPSGLPGLALEICVGALAFGSSITALNPTLVRAAIRRLRGRA